MSIISDDVISRSHCTSLKQGQIHGAMMKNCLNSIEHIFLTANVRFIPQHRYFFHFGSVFVFVCVFVCFCVLFATLCHFGSAISLLQAARSFVSVCICVHSALRLEVIWSLHMFTHSILRHQSLSHELESEWLSERLSAAERERELSTAKQENEWAKREKERPFFPELEFFLCQFSSDFFVKILKIIFQKLLILSTSCIHCKQEKGTDLISNTEINAKI